MAGSRQFSVISDNEIVKCQGHVCLIMKIGNQFGSLGKCTKLSMWSLGSAEVVRGLGYQLVKVWQGGDGSFCGLWVRSDGWRSSSGKRETRYQLLTGLHWDLQQNHDTVDRVTGGRKWGNIHWWAWGERHSNWHSNPTGVGNRSLQRHDTDLHSIVTGAKWVWQFIAAVWFLVVVMLWAIEGLVFISPGECLAKWTWGSLVVSKHFAVTMLIRQSCCISLTAVPCMDEI